MTENDGSNTDLKYTFGDGWSVEVHGGRTHGALDEFHVMTFAIVNADGEEVYEGEVELKEDQFGDGLTFYHTLCGVIYTLRQDRRRDLHPHRYDDTSDRGILIVDERVRLWLTMSDEKMFDLALNEIAGTTRRGRYVWEKGKWERARAIG